MSRIWHRDWLNRSAHPSEEDLVGFVSNEGSTRAAAQIQKHLEECWHCQARQEEIKQAIINVVNNLNEYVGDLAASSSGAQARFDRTLRQLAEEKRKPAPFTQLLSLLDSALPSRYVVRQFVAGGVCLAILLAFVRLTSTAPMSAKECLSRLEAAEQQRLYAVPNAAIHQKLRVTRKSTRSGHEQSLTWEIWDDTLHNTVRNHVVEESAIDSASGTPSRALFWEVSSPRLTDLNEVFAANGIDPRNPLSPQGFDRWRQSLVASSDRVVGAGLPDGGAGMALRTASQQPVAEGRILNAELIFSPEDWHAVEQRLTVQQAGGVDEYDLQETTFQVVTLDSVPLAVFADAASLTALPLSRHERFAEVIALPASFVLDEAELSAKFSLHRIDEYLRGQIQVRQDPSGVVKIEGLVDTQERKAELTSLLQSIHYTDVKIRTTDEALSESQASPQVSAKPQATVAQEPENTADSNRAQQNQAWLQQQWIRYAKQFPGKDAHEIDQQAVDLSNHAMSHARAASLQVWALRRLAQDYPPERVAALTSWSRWLLQMMIQDHTQSLEAEIEELRSESSPVLELFAPLDTAPANSVVGSTSTSTVEVPPAPSTWQAHVETLFKSVDAMVQQTLGVFGNPVLLPGTAQDAVQALVGGLVANPLAVKSLEVQASSDFRRGGDAPEAGNAAAGVIKY